MRPINLVMTAFGSYKERTEVPFSELRSGLYLITGDTGAGKTTIFDAIVFALYGTLCGTEREDRQPEMMHSDYTSKSVDTEVRLTFSEGGKVYTVERTIHFQKKRGLEDAYGEPRISAVLTEPDKDPIQGARVVSARVQELLGMDANQFRKIVMLAQGEFSKFLKANSDEKNRILSELFDNRLYEYYAELLAAAKRKLETARAERSRAVAGVLNNVFIFPADMPDARRSLFHPEHPELCENLENLIAEEDAAVRELAGEADEVRKGLDALNRQQGAAGELNRRFDELAERREHLAALEGQEAAVEAGKAALSRAESALHEAMPRVRERSRAERELADNGALIRYLEGNVEKLEAEVRAAEAAKSGDEERRRKAEELRNMIGKISEQLPHYKKLEEELAAQQAALNKARKAQADIEHRTRDGEAAEEYIKDHKNELLALEGIDGLVFDRRSAALKAERALERLVGAGGLAGRIREIKERERRLADAEEDLRAEAKHASRKMEEYNRIYQRFVAGQAGLLAGELRLKIEAEGSAKCPVCGALRGAEDVRGFAFAGEDIPDKKTVDVARTRQEAAERKRAAADRIVGSLIAEIAEKKRAALEAAAALLAEEADWEALASEEYLTAKETAFRKDAAAAQAALREALSGQARRDKLKKEADEAERRLGEIREAVRQAEGVKAGETAKAAAAGARAESLRVRLLHGDEAEARQEIRNLAGEEKAITEAVRRHDEAFEAASGRCTAAKGQLTAREEQKSTLEGNLKKAKERLAETLAGLHFADEAEVLAALPPVKAELQEGWLRQERAVLNGYDNDRKNTANEIRNLEARLAGKARTDLSALAEEIAAADGVLREKNEAKNKKAVLCENHRRTLRLVRGQKAYLDMTAEAWKRVNRLGSLAEGEKSEGGRISFDRYVIGAVFREILEMANRRLDIMSGGKYRLVYKSGAKRTNAAAGLETSVLDLATGKERDSNSLSGGESFFTSLALALGLSDVVQNHAGGRRLDALFVDEGFGTLSDDVLDLALNVLGSLTEGDRMVGLISHVDKLNESIPQKIYVKNGKNGSTLTMETA